MSIMSELHQEASDNERYLESIHNILLGQRKVAQGRIDSLSRMGSRNPENYRDFNTRIACISDLLLEFEAAGVVWPDNVVTLDTVTSPLASGWGKTKRSVPNKCNCGGDIHPEHGPWG